MFPRYLLSDQLMYMLRISGWRGFDPLLPYCRALYICKAYCAAREQSDKEACRWPPLQLRLRGTRAGVNQGSNLHCKVQELLRNHTVCFV